MPNLAAISFTAPVFALGASLVILPIIAHLLSRRTRQRIVFPSIDLLKAAAASQSSMLKLRRWWLLLLRCLAVLLLVLAFMQPTWLSARAGQAEPQGQSIVIVLDVSASTGQIAGGIPIAQRLRSRAEQVIDALQVGRDRANIVTADAHPSAVFNQLSANPDALRQAIQDTQPKFDRANFPAAIALAVTQLKNAPGERRLVIISDMQASNWHEAIKALAGQSIIPPGIGVTLLNPDAQSPANLALHDPNVSPATPRIGRPCRFSVTVTNHGDHVQPATVQLTLGAAALPGESLTLGPHEQREVTFTGRLDSPGAHRLVFSLQQDALPIDDRCFLVARAAEQTPVLLVTDDDANRPGSAGYLLLRALAPFGDQRDRFAVTPVPGAALSESRLADAAVVFIDKSGPLSESQLNTLLRFIRQGGGAVFFCSDTVSVSNLRALDQLVSDEVSLWLPTALRQADTPDQALTIDHGDWQSPLLKRFGPAARIALANVPIHAAWTGGQTPTDAKVLLAYHDASPALVYHDLGAGRFAVANFSADPKLSDLGRHGLFVALMQGLADDMQPRTTTRRDILVGHALTLDARHPVDPKGPAPHIIQPDGQTAQDAVLSLGDHDASLTLHSTDAPGFYSAMQGDTLLATEAVNLDPRESDLRRINTDTLIAALSSSDSAAPPSIDRDTSAIADHGKALWGGAVLLACAMLLAEMWLLGYRRP